MYTVTNYPTKKALKTALANGERIGTFQPGPFPAKLNGEVALEGPHYPKPHTWYASATIVDGYVTRVK